MTRYEMRSLDGRRLPGEPEDDDAAEMWTAALRAATHKPVVAVPLPHPRREVPVPRVEAA